MALDLWGQKSIYTVGADYLHLLQALLLHHPLPRITKGNTTWTFSLVNFMNMCFPAAWRYSLSLLCCHQHLCLPCYPETKQLWYHINEKALPRWCLVALAEKEPSVLMLSITLTFSPNRPLSPAVPGSVWPLRPCINHNQERDVSFTEPLCSASSIS